MHTQNGIGSITTQRPLTGLSWAAESQLRDALRDESPSEPWVEAQFVEFLQADKRGNTVVRRRHDPSVFPPGGAKTGMVRCRICGVFTPPNAMEGGVCLDHREPGNWGPSPSAVSIRKALQRFQEEAVIELEPDSDEALSREIRLFNRNRSKWRRNQKMKEARKAKKLLKRQG